VARSGEEINLSNSVINFTRGIPPAEVFPVDDLIRAAESALRNDFAVLLQYGRSPGYKPLRELLASWYDVGPDQVLIGNSSLEIIDFISRTKLDSRRRVFVEAPSYDRTITTFRRAGAEVVGIPLQGDGVELEALERELKAGPPAVFYIVSDFQNPMGTTTCLEKRQQVARWATQYGFWIIEDAPYRRLRYWGQEAPTIYSLAPDHTYHLCSFSKTLAPGLRLGYAVATPEAIAELADFAVDTYIGPVLPTQGAVYEYCRLGLLEPNVDKLKALYAPRLRATLRALERYLPEATWSQPEGGFFVGVQLPEAGTMDRLLPKAVDAGLKLSDGRGFYPAPRDGDRFLRIPFCSVTLEEIDNGIARLASILTG
jgi:DNA-binding transcriptional MocR family regulator